jgi:dephospho-CoA kinase
MLGRKILIYGSIGSGKTTFSKETFNSLPLVELDDVNRNLIEPGNPGYIQLKKILVTSISKLMVKLIKKN